MNVKLKFVLFIISTAFAGIAFYILLHETGHCLVAAACGAEITKFSLLDASMAYMGGSFSKMTASLFQVAGALFPIMIVWLLLWFYKRNTKGMLYHCSYLMFTCLSIGSSLAWILVPLVSLFAAPPAGDDITNFMAASGISPISIMSGTLLVILLTVWFAARRGLFSAFRQMIKEMNAREANIT